jgi:hypothetical protein
VAKTVKSVKTPVKRRGISKTKPSIQEMAAKTTDYVNREMQKVDGQPKLNLAPVPQAIVEVNSTPSGPKPVDETQFHSEFCFVSLVLGIFGLVLPLFSTLAIIFGIGGLMQVHREKMEGKWMAVMGIILGFVGILIIVVALLFGISFLEGYLTKMGVKF